MYFIFSEGFLCKLSALIIFVVASYTDYLDGYFAKKRNEVTNFGKLMDPIADKILMLSAFLAFVEMNLVPAWMVVVIIFRELIITGVRLLALTKGVVMEASIAGKQKTVSQVLSVFVILLFIVFKEAGRQYFDFWGPDFEYWYRQIIFFMMIATVTLTVVSGASYIFRNKRVVWAAQNGKTD